MSAIMLNNENTNEKKSVQKRQRQREPIRNEEAEIHQRPKADERQKGGYHLQRRFGCIRRLVFFYHLLPIVHDELERIVVSFFHDLT